MTESLAQRIEPEVEPEVEIKPTKKPTEEIITPETVEKPPSISDPYINKLLNIGEAKDHFEMPRLITEINDFVLSEMKRKGLEDTNEVYKEIVDKYKIPKDLDIYTYIERLNSLMMIDKKLINAMIEKEELKKKPIEELTSYQLRQRIEEK